MSGFYAILLIAGASIFVIIAWQVLSALARAAFSRLGASQNVGLAAMPVGAKPEDFHTMVVFLGGLQNRGDQKAAIQKEVDRQVRDEQAKKQIFASIAFAWCLPDGQIYVRLHKSSMQREVLWEGAVGQIPQSYLPRDGVWPVEGVRLAESVVRSQVEAALAA
ncbi:hypothetical protein [Rhizobium miluonense]|uniref:Uncharacterized protein n=1 Tax=Rhizobium miluonense TaxID=411945 RepID=A0ABU1SMI9_9HYPH|nr:hypothetical protein [Rhizobium miluonense]MDR6900199.1 hypothetical protein [Rhizobium miluonense]